MLLEEVWFVLKYLIYTSLYWIEAGHPGANPYLSFIRNSIHFLGQKGWIIGRHSWRGRLQRFTIHQVSFENTLRARCWDATKILILIIVNGQQLWISMRAISVHPLQPWGVSVNQTWRASTFQCLTLRSISRTTSLLYKLHGESLQLDKDISIYWKYNSAFKSVSNLSRSHSAWMSSRSHQPWHRQYQEPLDANLCPWMMTGQPLTIASLTQNIYSRLKNHKIVQKFGSNLQRLRYKVQLIFSFQIASKSFKLGSTQTRKLQWTYAHLVNSHP